MPFFETIKDGIAFEHYCAHVLRLNSFTDVQVTPASNDYGVDILAIRDEVTYAVQCKLYSTPIGISAIQEIISGREYYGCDIGVVMTNNSFTDNAIELAKKVGGIKLWGHDKLCKFEQTITPIEPQQPIDDSYTIEVLDRALLELNEWGYASTSFLQRKLNARYSVCARIMNDLDAYGCLRMDENRLKRLAVPLNSPNIEALRNAIKMRK